MKRKIIVAVAIRTAILFAIQIQSTVVFIFEDFENELSNGLGVAEEAYSEDEQKAEECRQIVGRLLNHLLSALVRALCCGVLRQHPAIDTVSPFVKRDQPLQAVAAGIDIERVVLHAQGEVRTAFAL